MLKKSENQLFSINLTKVCQKYKSLLFFFKIVYLLHHIQIDVFNFLTLFSSIKQYKLQLSNTITLYLKYHRYEMGNIPSPLSFFCDDIQFLEQYNQSIKKLRKFIDECQVLYYQIEKLKEERYSKAQNHFVIDSEMSQTSNQQLMQYCHLIEIQQELNKIIDQSTTIFQNYSELKDGKSRVQAITAIAKFIEETNNQFIIIKQTIDIIRKGDTKYSEKQESVFFSYKNNDRHAFNVQILLDKKLVLTQKLHKTELIRTKLHKSQEIKKDIPFDLKDQINKLIIEKDKIQNQIKQSQNAISQLPEQNKTYINEVFGQKILSDQLVYKKITQKDIEYYLQQLDIRKLSLQTYELNHSYVKIEDMNSFVSLQWEKVSFLNLVSCKIKEKRWKQLCENAKNFSQLRILWISQNFIENMKLEDLYQFPKLEFVYYEILRAINEKQIKLLNIIGAHMNNQFNPLVVNEFNKKLKRNLKVYF